MNRTPPTIILTRLRGLWSRELLLRLVWGAARLGAIVLFVLMIACVIDWWIDRDRDTPIWFRRMLTGGQVVLALGLIYQFIVRPWRQMPTLDTLAGVVEQRIPAFGHRLVTALQLNQPNKTTSGMSEALIRDLTREAEQLSEQHAFAPLADHRRFRWAGLALLPIALIVAIPFLVNPTLSSILVQRQFGANLDIPRNISLVSITEPIQPAGDELLLRIEATAQSGAIDPELLGTVRVSPEGQPSDRYPLTFAEEVAPGKAIFTTKLPKSSVPLTFHARIGDGRMREPFAIRFEPRPVVVRIDAWVRLPEFVGKRPDGQLYEEFQAQGEINGYQNGTARVRLETQKPIQSATLVLYGRPGNSEIEQPLKRVPMNLVGDQGAEVVFDVDKAATAYRLEVVDKFGFANHNPPRRNIAVVPDEAPYVALLPEQFPGDEEGDANEADVEGIPVPLNKTIRIGYYARSPLGLGKARLAYRVNDGAWKYLPLGQVQANTEQVGAFDTRRGVFDRTGFLDQVEFFPVPSVDPQMQPNGLEGGGRFDFQTRGLTKKLPDGQEVPVDVGDRIEFAVEVYDRDPTFGRAPGRSEPRLKGIVDLKGFFAWMDTVVQNEQKLRRLRDKQQSVFDEGN